ncbi:MAG: hypothetical protein DCF15_03140 [Phormidesmis priestleyi]|uniref:Uncharacterized protein n=1 Tax=Phormidesmis priestleyi TaxID=268141 RepID=A0A2W4XZC4_9CYAN|nr:MAG: hypothetical protein DCF15_03140 [Phormidesmis priestleyi]
MIETARRLMPPAMVKMPIQTNGQTRSESFWRKRSPIVKGADGAGGAVRTEGLPVDRFAVRFADRLADRFEVRVEVMGTNPAMTGLNQKNLMSPYSSQNMEISAQTSNRFYQKIWCHCSVN